MTKWTDAELDALFARTSHIVAELDDLAREMYLKYMRAEDCLRAPRNLVARFAQIEAMLGEHIGEPIVTIHHGQAHQIHAATITSPRLEFDTHTSADNGLMAGEVRVHADDHRSVVVGAQYEGSWRPASTFSQPKDVEERTRLTIEKRYYARDRSPKPKNTPSLIVVKEMNPITLIGNDAIARFIGEHSQYESIINDLIAAPVQRTAVIHNDVVAERYLRRSFTSAPPTPPAGN